MSVPTAPTVPTPRGNEKTTQFRGFEAPVPTVPTYIYIFYNRTQGTAQRRARQFYQSEIAEVGGNRERFCRDPQKSAVFSVPTHLCEGQTVPTLRRERP